MRGEPVGHEHAEQAAVIERVAVEVGGAFPGNDRLQRRRRQIGDEPLVHRVIGNADEADFAVAPGLRRRPFDGVVEVDRFGLRPRLVLAGRLAAAAAVDAHGGVTLRHPPQRIDGLPVHIRVGLFLQRVGRDPQLVFLIGTEIEQRRHPFITLRTEDVGHQPRAIAHRHCDVFFDQDCFAARTGMHVHASNSSRSDSAPAATTISGPPRSDRVCR